MCSINHELKAIFIHIPKNAGSYIQTILEKYYNFKTIFFTREDHNIFVENNENILDNNDKLGFVKINKKGLLRYYITSDKHNILSGMNLQKWNEYYKFTFIRNPYDKIISSWQFLNKVHNINTKYENFLNFLNSKEICTPSKYSHAFITQYNHILNEKDELSINYFGKFENLNSDLINILLKLGITEIKHKKYLLSNIKINTSSENINYIEYYNDKTLKIVNNYFKEDFDNFNFKICNNLVELKNNSNIYFIINEKLALENKNLIKLFDNKFLN
jgi:hypothetical protein